MDHEHARCRCGYSLLRAVASSNPHATYDTTCWYQYREAAASGPAAPIISCPACGTPLDIPTVHAFSEEERQ